MILQKAESKDLEQIKEIYNYARFTMGALGIDQWQDGYPTEDITAKDLQQGNLYVCRDNEGLLGVCVIIKDGEPTYNEIYDGKWIGGEKYLAVHRFAVAERARRMGVGSFMMNRIFAIAKDGRFPSVRIDTHRGNTPMRSMLEKLGMTHCGTIYLESGDSRVAYEKRIKLPLFSKTARGIMGFLLLFAALFAVAAFLSETFGSSCPTYLIGHFCCPFCGMTRAHLAALQLDFDLALYYHPVFFLGIPYFLLLTIGDYLPKKLHTCKNITILIFTLIIVIVYFIRICRFGIDFFN